MSKLLDWIEEIESINYKGGFCRCYTDENHGIYFDVYNDKAVTMDGEELTFEGNELDLFQADLKHGADFECILTNFEV